MVENVKISIPYSREWQTADFPADNLIGLAKAPGLICAVADEVAEVRRALRNPVGCLPLKELVVPGYKVAIVVSDFTRPTPSGRILGPVLEELQQIGVLQRDITIVVACGLHVASSRQQLEIMLGEEILANYTIINHNADDSGSLAYLGRTSGDIPIEINKVVAEANFCISIGGIDPHQWAGFSGGAKNLLPGVSSRRAINAHHLLLMDPDTGVGKLAGNKFRQQLEEAARVANFNFIVNVVLTPDKKIAYAVAGDVVEAHRQGAAYAEEKLWVSVPDKADIVIASPGGFPRDSDLWQTDGKCLTRIAPFVKEGGTVIIVSQCSQGLGNTEFAQLLNTKSAEELEVELSRGPFSTALAKAYHFAKLAGRTDFYLVTEGIKAEMLPRIPIYFFTSLNCAIRKALTKNPHAKTLIVPDAAGVLLKLQDQSKIRFSQ